MASHYQRYILRKRAAVFVQVAVLSVVIFGFAVLMIDLGAVYNTRNDLQTAADTAAMAGVSAMMTDQMMPVRQIADSAALMGILKAAQSRIDLFAAMNPSLGTSTTHVELNDIQSGYLDLSSATSLLTSAVNASDYNAVQVTVRRNADGPNGPVEFFFASILGIETGTTFATSTAAYDDQFAGVDLNQLGDGTLPITLHINEFEAQMVSGDDAYEFDPNADQVTEGSDGVREIRVYPYEGQPGNFGLLNIGRLNRGTPALAAQIENGVSAEDVKAEIGTDVLTFCDADGRPVNYLMDGNPGMTSALESSLSQRVGDVVSYFLHDQATDNGSNVTYRIVRLVYGRLMAADLHGNPNQRGVWIQPVSYAGTEVIISPDAPSSDGLVGRIVLAR